MNRVNWYQYRDKRGKRRENIEKSCSVGDVLRTYVHKWPAPNGNTLFLVRLSSFYTLNMLVLGQAPRSLSENRKSGLTC